MGKFIRIATIVAVVLAGVAPAANAAQTKKALVYGDSLVWESGWSTAQTFNAHPEWNVVNHSMWSTAPCDWLAELPSDLSTFHPATVTIATAGNTQGTACMSDPTGSPAYYARYKADLNSIFSDVTATGAKMVFVDDPPFVDPVRDAAVIQIIAIATQLAGDYHGVSIVATAREQLSKHGEYTSYKPCLPTETAPMGCSNGKIAIRTITGPQAGLHLCPPGLPDNIFPPVCQVYSSGELRFGRDIADAAIHPPPPVMP